MRTMKTSLHVLKVCVSLCQIKYVLFSFREARIRIVSLIETYSEGSCREWPDLSDIKADLSFFYVQIQYCTLTSYGPYCFEGFFFNVKQHM